MKFKPFLLAVIIFVGLFSGSGFVKAAVFEQGILIENVTIIDPGPKEIKTFKGIILVQDGLIAYVGKKKPTVLADVQKINGKGKFLIPGLIDSHTHLANPAGLNGRLRRKYPELAASYLRQMPKSYLYFGYTTLIDLNNHSPGVMNSILEETIRPEVYTCGEQLEVWNGFMMAESEPEERLRDFPNFLHDRYSKNVSIPETVDLKGHTPLASIRRIIREQNGICAKIAFENGFGGTEEVTWEMPGKEIISELTAEAEKENIPVLLHANSFESQKFALETGVDIIAHGMWHWGLLKDFLNVRELPETHQMLLREIARRRIGYQPTFRVIAGQRDVFDDDFLNDEKLEHVYPEDLLKWLRSVEGNWQQENIRKYAKGFFDGKTNGEVVPFMQMMVDKIGVSTKLLAANDANLLLGSDTPSGNSHTNPPGYNGYLEMIEWHKAGISLEQIFRAATINNAKAFHLENLYGSIGKGKKANLLLLRKNPLKDISAYDSIDRIIVRGKVFERKSLSATAR